MNVADSQFLKQAFETHDLASLNHTDHIRLAWLVLSHHDLHVGIGILCDGFQKFAAAKGTPQVFHTTITWAFAVLINQRIQQGRGGNTWQHFMELNEDLSEGSRVLLNFYDQQTLDSEFARNHFAMPCCRKTPQAD